MKQLHIYCIFLLGTFQLNNLNAQYCAPSTQSDFLYGNQIRSPFHTGGDMFWDLSDGQFYVPSSPDETETPPSTVFAAALWVGGLDGANNLQMAAQTYRQSGNDFWPGPIDDDGNVSVDECANFDRIWRMPEYAVSAHLADFADGTLDNPIDPHLKQWPAKGNPYFFDEFGFNLPMQDLAPFADVNMDGLYDPADGDYPVIDPAWPDVIAADMIWMVFNDRGNIHSETNGIQIGLEVQLTAYAFDCDQDSILDRTIFTKHKLINKNDEGFFEAYAGLWMDFDLGCWDDDFLGSAPDLNTFYVYNGSNDDADCSDFSGGLIKGYGSNPPVQAVTFLNQDLAAFAYYNGDATPQGNPNSAGDYYDYMRGLWRDGSPIEFGGDGYNEATFPTPFMFSDDPNDTSLGSWSEVSENNSPSDRRGVGSVGPFDLPTMTSITVDAAYSFHWDTTRSNLGNVTFMYENVPKIQALFDSGFAPTTLQCAPAPTCVTDCVWPGDTDYDGIVSHLDIINLGLANSLSGPNRTGTIWSPYTVTDWTNDFADGTNHKHADCDGDGAIAAVDLDIVDNNYGSTNGFFDGTYGNTNGGDLIRYVADPVISFNDTVVPGQNVYMNVHIGSDYSLENVHGLGFSIGTDDNLIRPFLVNAYPDIAGLNSDNTAINILKKTDPDAYKGRYEYGASRLDGLGKNMFGNILTYRFQVANDIFDYLPANDPYIHLTFENMRAMQPDGTEITLFGGNTYSIYVEDPTIGTKDLLAPQLSISPNPATDVIRVALDKGRAESVILHDAMGRLVHHSSPQSTQFEVKVAHLATGIYFLSVEQDGRWTREKVLIL